MDTSQTDLMLAELSRVQVMARSLCEGNPGYLSSEDLVQAGAIGLIEAFQKFEPGRQIQFWSYAQHRVRGAMLDSLRDWDWAPRELRKRARDLEKCRDRQALLRGREATEEEVADELGIEIEELHDLLTQIERSKVHHFSSATTTTSGCVPKLDEIVGCGETNPLDHCLASERHATLSRLLDRLPERQKEVLTLFYYRDVALQDIATMMHVGPSRISQIHSAAIERLRELIKEEVGNPQPRKRTVAGLPKNTGRP